MKNFHARSCPNSIGDSTSTYALGAKYVRGSDVGVSAVSTVHAGGIRSDTCTGASSAPTTYMNACGPPVSPPVGDRNGFQAARGD